MRIGIPRGIPGSQQGANLNKQRGNVWVDNGYESDTAPNVLPNGHPNPMLLTNYRDQYARVFPDGPYDRAWQGIQKINPIAQLSIGRQVMPNPYHRNRMAVPHIHLTNAATHSVGAGTALAAFNEQQAQLAANARPSIVSTLLSRLRGQ